MIAALMIVGGLAMLLIAAIPPAWAPIGRAVHAMNTALAPLAVRPFAALFHKTEDEVQASLVHAARFTFGFLGVVLILGAATYASTT
jgi:hypothetical protein